MKKFLLVWVIFAVIAIVGEVKCIKKAINANWEPAGKSAIVYTVAACTGLGSIVGYFDIKD